MVFRLGAIAVLITSMLTLADTTTSLASEASTGIFAGDSHYSLVISGGISLGNYEAGVNWAMMRTMRSEKAANRDALRSVVGASAGGINTLANAAYWCIADTSSDGGEGGFRDTVDENIFKNIWADVGFDDLLPKDSKDYMDGDGLLSRKSFDKVTKMLNRYLMTSKFADCRIPIALTLTKVNNQSIEMNGITVSNNRYVLPLYFVTNSSGAYFENLKEINKASAALMGNRIYLPTLDNTHVHISKVLDAAKATSAFPVAFGTMMLEVCDEKDVCGEVEFMDGGVFDNVPLGTAVAISNIANSPQSVNFLMIDPDNLRLAPKKAAPLLTDGKTESYKNDAKDKSFMEQLKFIKSFYGAARSYELYSSLRYIKLVLDDNMDCNGVDFNNPLCKPSDGKNAGGNPASGNMFCKRVSSEDQAADAGGKCDDKDKGAKKPKNIDKVCFATSTRFPLLTGNYMIAFGAFLDDAFRRYDYYAGVYDGILNMAMIKCGSYDYSCLGNKAHDIYNSLGIADSKDASMVFSYLAHEEFSGHPEWQWAYDEANESTGSTGGEECLKTFSYRQGECIKKSEGMLCKIFWPLVGSCKLPGCMAGYFAGSKCSLPLYAVTGSIYNGINDKIREPDFEKFIDNVATLYPDDYDDGNMNMKMSASLESMIASEGWGNTLLERALTRLKDKDYKSDNGKLGPIFGLGGSYVQSQIEKRKFWVGNRTSSKSEWVKYIVPYELSVNLNTRAFQATWEMRFNLNRFERRRLWFDSLALNVRYGGGTEENVILEREGEEHWYAVVQPFLTLEGDLFTVGITPISYTWMRDYKALGYAAYIGLLDDRIRLTYGEREYGRTKFKKDTFVTIGIADVAGLIGWITK